MIIPHNNIFWESGDSVFLVTNWRDRTTGGGKPALFELSSRHLRRYKRYKKLGRSPKSIYYLLLKDKDGLSTTRITSPVRKGNSSKSTQVEVPIEILDKMQLIKLILALTGERMPYLMELSVKDLRHLFQSIKSLK